MTVSFSAFRLIIGGIGLNIQFYKSMSSVLPILNKSRLSAVNFFEPALLGAKDICRLKKQKKY